MFQNQIVIHTNALQDFVHELQTLVSQLHQRQNKTKTDGINEAAISTH
jgi:hypothetical protein